MNALRTLLLGVLFAVVAVFPGCQKYDVLVEKNQICDEKWADIDAQLQRRYDLVPNLVATVKGSAAHEETTLAKVTEARAQATQIKLTADDLSDPDKMAAFQKAQDELRGSLSRLMVVQEQYPTSRRTRSSMRCRSSSKGPRIESFARARSITRRSGTITPSSRRSAARS